MLSPCEAWQNDLGERPYAIGRYAMGHSGVHICYLRHRDRVGVLFQAGILFGFFIAFLKLQGKLEKILTHVTEHALPLIESSKVMLQDLSPKVTAIGTNLVEVSDMLKHETATIKVSVDEVLEKTRAQTARVDEMVSGTLDGISQASATIQQGVEVPLRHIHGVFNGVKAAFETLKGKPARPVLR